MGDLVNVFRLVVVVGQAAACDRAEVKGRFTRRGRVARLGCSIDLLVVDVFFDLVVDFDLLVSFDVVSHARSVPAGADAKHEGAPQGRVSPFRLARGSPPHG